MTTKLQITYLPPSALKPNPWNTNSVGPEMEKRLRASIEENGFYKPIIVRTLSDGSLEILGGEHRWRVATQLGHAEVPVLNLGTVSDSKAKLMGLADNAQYGNDDALALAALLREIGRDDVAAMLPYSEEDLAGMFAASEIELDTIGFDDNDQDDVRPLDELVRPTATHELMRFKVPIEDRERVQALIDHVISTQGLKSEQDSMVAAGMALVVIANTARGALA